MRAITSAGPPAANGTVNITGLDGKSCAAHFRQAPSPATTDLKIRYIARPLIFSYFDFLAARTENAVRSARPEKVIAENPKYA
jgi:hypothetical protein